MKKIKLKDNSIIYIDKFRHNKEDGKCRIYDSNKQYLDYFEEDGQTKKDYKNFIHSLSQLNAYEVFMLFADDSFSSSISAKSIIEHYVEAVIACNNNDEADEILHDLETMTDDEICEYYNMNKIGKMYFWGN